MTKTIYKSKLFTLKILSILKERFIIINGESIEINKYRIDRINQIKDLEEIIIFDVFKGDKIAPGEKMFL
ncbi:MAG: hypothetical protein Ct9H300mP6_19170 [Gammaproteobacteria bacterium]|nr:MAG: hypothetical protein Ct9H300mP6_19170 [Gammaproteobacteria bacterium]